jgi:sialic acid synthase SpsE
MIKKNPYIIAEIGLNHNGKFSIAKESIIKAKTKCNANL